jgi:hypothetical protein
MVTMEKNFEVQTCYESCGVGYEFHSNSWTSLPVTVFVVRNWC